MSIHMPKIQPATATTKLDAVKPPSNPKIPQANSAKAPEPKAPKASKADKIEKPEKTEKPDKLKDDKVSGTQLWLVLIKAFHSMMAFTDRTLADSGLGQSEFRILEALLHKGPMPVNVVGPRVFLTPGSISVAVDRLLKRGLVTRTGSADDRRVRVVALTPSGRRLIEKVFAAHSAQVDSLAHVLSAKERRQIARGLKTLGKAAAPKP